MYEGTVLNTTMIFDTNLIFPISIYATSCAHVLSKDSLHILHYVQVLTKFQAPQSYSFFWGYVNDKFQAEFFLIAFKICNKFAYLTIVGTLACSLKRKAKRMNYVRILFKSKLIIKFSATEIVRVQSWLQINLLDCHYLAKNRAQHLGFPNVANASKNELFETDLKWVPFGKWNFPVKKLRLDM